VAHANHEAGRGGEDPREWFDRLSNPVRRLKDMDAQGIDVMVVSPAPPLYLYGIEPSYAVPFCQAYNDALAEYCTTDSDRLYFLATLPLQDIGDSVKETERSLGDLGARGVYIGASNLAGRELDDRAFFPLFETLSAHDLPLCIHPYPVALNMGGDCYHEKLSLGFPAQETHAIFRLIAGGVLDEFPDLKVFVSHGGGFFAFQIGRFDPFLEISDDSLAKRPIAEYLGNLYFDILLHDVRARRLLIEVAGIDHVLLGSNYAGMDSVDGLAFVEELDLPDGDRMRVVSDNAAALFKLAGK
jgi:predicted TIM-barrel fold metal-dependent hydrolase